MSQAKPTVLIADDDSFFRQLLKLVAEASGWEVTGEAGDGEQAVAMYAANQPDMLWLDMNMPKLNGDEALQQIMSADTAAFVVMLTGEEPGAQLQTCLQAGAKNYVCKSDPATMGAQLQEIWDSHSSA